MFYNMLLFMFSKIALLIRQKIELAMYHDLLSRIFYRPSPARIGAACGWINRLCMQCMNGNLQEDEKKATDRIQIRRMNV